MRKPFWQDYVQAAVASRNFGDALEICLRALTDEAPTTFDSLSTLTDALPGATRGRCPADVADLLQAAMESLAGVEDVLGLTALVIEASGGRAAPAIPDIDPDEIAAAAAKTRAMPGGAQLARHVGALRRAAYSAAGHIERVLTGPDSHGPQALTDLTDLIHAAQAGLHLNHKLLAAAACLLQEPDPDQS